VVQQIVGTVPQSYLHTMEATLLITVVCILSHLDRARLDLIANSLEHDRGLLVKVGMK
jgi:hypothetical protein